jgi:putative ABC transport system permease protein
VPPWSIELKHAYQALRRRPGFSIAATALLAVAVGTNVAIFSLVQAVLLRPLPYANPDRLVALYSEGRDRAQQPFSIPDFLDLREGNETLGALAAYGSWGANLTGGGETERLQGIWAAGDLFGLLGTRAALGRPLVRDDERPGAPHVVVLAHGLWKRRFGGSSAVLGSDVVLNGERYTVVGVLAPDFVLPGREAELAVPLSLETDARRQNRGAGFLRVVARLRPGVQHDAARADLSALAARLQTAHPVTNAGASRVAVVPLQEAVVGSHRSLLLVLQGAVVLVMLMVCANLAGLILARASSRHGELAVRAALGATRGRLVLQLGAESLLLGLTGGLGGVLLAYALLPVLLALGPTELPRMSQVRLDVPTLAFSLLAALVASLLSGLLPALQATRTVRRAGSLTGRTVSTSLPVARRAVVLLEVALSLVMLAGAGLLVKSFVQLQRVDPGFRTDKVLSLRLSLPKARYARREQLVAFYERLRPRLLALPGTEGVGLSSVAPLTAWRASVNFTTDGTVLEGGRETPLAQYRVVDSDYFTAAGTPLLSGRSFTDADDATGAPVALVNRTLAQRFWPGGDALGRRIRFDDAGVPAREALVVGIVGDVKHYALSDAPTYDIYVPLRQAPEAVVGWLANGTSWVVRTRSDPEVMVAAVRSAVAQVDPEVAASSVRSMESALSATLAPRRFNLVLVGTFAVVALALALTGLYTVTAQLVMRRTREIGIRVALGARRPQVLRLVLKESAVLVTGGLVLGGLGAYGVGRLLDTLLFDVARTDGFTFSLVAATLVATALLASYLPARRALSVDPTITLRAE